MGIKSYVAIQDTTISNAFLPGLRTRATGSNAGACDILEVFSIFQGASSSSYELSKTLLQFPVTQMNTDRTAGKLPASGSVSFILRLFNAPHAETLPRQYTLKVFPVSQSWEEGNGVDLENYSDITRNGLGANWLNAASSSLWSTQGGSYLSGSLTSSQFFDQGFEDLSLDISPLVESWMSGTTANYGVGIMLTGSQESGSTSYYTKRFFARTSEFFFKRPVIEARWDGSTKDDRSRFYISSSLLNASDNLHTVYIYNYYQGALKNISGIGTGPVYLQVYTSQSLGGIVPTIPSVVTGGYVSTGVYSASFALVTTSSLVYDKWFSGSTFYHTGTILPLTFDANEDHLVSKSYVVSLTNLKLVYSTQEQSRIRMFIRSKDWNPNIYAISSKVLPNTIVDNVYFKVLRMTDNNDMIQYGTGSVQYTKLSYDKSGNFFDFDFSLLEPSYGYGFKFCFLLDGVYEEQNGIFRFRVQDT